MCESLPACRAAPCAHRAIRREPVTAWSPGHPPAGTPGMKKPPALPRADDPACRATTRMQTRSRICGKEVSNMVMPTLDTHFCGRVLFLPGRGIEEETWKAVCLTIPWYQDKPFPYHILSPVFQLLFCDTGRCADTCNASPPRSPPTAGRGCTVAAGFHGRAGW